MFGVLGHDTGPEESIKPFGKNYRPIYLDHIHKKISEKSKVIINN